MKISIDEYISMQQDGQVLNEAFKAGNRARKKESARDTVGEINPLVDTLLDEINTGDLVRRYLEKNRYLTVHATFRDIILHVLSRLTNVERDVLNHCLQVYTYQQSGGEFGVIHFRTMGSFKTKLDDGRLVFEIKEDEPAKMVADFFEHGSDALLLHIDTHEAKLSESRVTAAGIGFCLKIVEMFNKFREGTDIYEAFKTGNRARKKESVRDTVDSVNVIDPETADHLLTEAIQEVNRWGYYNLFKVGSKLYITEFVRSLFGYVTGSSAPGEYLQISSMELDDEGMSGDMWIKYWGTKQDTAYTAYSRRWMVSWQMEPDGSFIGYRLADFKDSIEDSWSTPLLVVYADGSFETGPGFMSFVNDFTIESAKMYKAGMLIPQHPVDEAFRAGNRARKKESAQDTIESVDDIQAQIDRFREQTGKDLEIRDGRPYFDRYLDLKGCTRLTNLPTCLEVKEGLDLEGCTELKSLPAGLKVGGSLFLNGYTGLTSLPFDIVVQGYWIIHNGILTPFFRKLGIRVDKNGDTKAEDWREWQKAHGYLREAFKAGNRARKKESAQDAVESVDKLQQQIDLFKEQTDTELEIRDGRPYYDGNLWLRGCTKLTRLPDNLKVIGDLELSGCTELTRLPDNLKVIGYLGLTDCTGLASLPNGLKIAGSLGLDHCTGLTSLPFDLVVQGNWIIHRGILTQFFRKLRIPVDEYGDTRALDWREWQEAHGYLSEAFKAGNRARKKEAVADTVQTVEPTITCKDAVAKLTEFLKEPVRAPWDPCDRMSRCCDEDNLNDAVEYAEPEDPEDLYNFDFGICTEGSGRGFAFDYDTKININIYEEYGKDANGKKDRSAKIQRVSIGSTGVGSNNGTFDLLKQGRSDSDIYTKPIELTPATFASLMELCHILFPLNGNDSKLSYFIGGGNGAERVQTYGQFLYANQELLWPWLCQDDRMLVYKVEDELNMYDDDDDDDMDEAFRAGNRARKKETSQDIVQEVGESVEEQVERFKEEVGEGRLIYTDLQITDGRPVMTGPLNLNGLDSLTRLPDNLHVDYYCCISNCPNIEAIPHGLSTRTGALNADHCKNLKYVPNDIHINNTIYFNYCPSLESLPEGLKVYNGGIDLSYCTALKSLPENFEVSGPLKVTGCENLKTLPKGLSVDCLECEHSGLTELPLDIRFNDTGLWAFLRPNMEVSRFFHKITGVTFNSDKQPLMKEIWCRWQQEHGYVDYGIDLSKPVDINEGGKAVKGVSPIRGDLALTVANKAAGALMQQLPGVKIVPVGSVGKKPADQESGDIDLAVQVPWEQKDLVIQAVQKLVPDAECREFKALWLVSAPWPWREDGLYGRVQLDMFLGPDIRLTQFMRWSPNLAKGESRYKGLYRTALLISIASCIPAEGKQDVKFDGSDCLKDCWRYSLSPRTGLRIVHKTWASKTGKMLKNPKNVDEDTVIVAVDPQIIAVKLLGDGATLNDCVSLESIWKRMQSPQFPYKQYQDQILKEYYKYLQDAGEELPTMKQNEDNTDVKKD